MLALIPIVGTLLAVGAAMISEKVQDWLAGLTASFSAIPDKIAAVWDDLAKYIKEKWDGALSVLTSVGDWIKTITGFDVGKAAGAVGSAVGSVGSAIGGAFSGAVNWAKNATGLGGNGGINGADPGKTKAAMDFFVGKGLAPHQAAGIVGNMLQENAPFNLGASPGNPAHAGLFQWGGARQQGMGSTFGEQLQHAWNEMTGQAPNRDPGAEAALAQIRASTTAAQASAAFAQSFERAGADANLGARAGYANAALGAYQGGAGRSPNVTVAPGVDLSGVNPSLVDSIHAAALNWGGQVRIVSGMRGAGDKGNHSTGNAVDIELTDASGRVLPNKASKAGATPADAAAYERFMRDAVESQAPDFQKKSRWGGYFGDVVGDWMHLDLMAQKGKRRDLLDGAPPGLASLPLPPAAPAISSVPAPPAPTAPVAPAIPATPAVSTPLASAGGRAGAGAVAPSADVGQDISDRPLAHIVTGGLSGSD